MKVSRKPLLPRPTSGKSESTISIASKQESATRPATPPRSNVRSSTTSSRSVTNFPNISVFTQKYNDNLANEKNAIVSLEYEIETLTYKIDKLKMTKPMTEEMTNNIKELEGKIDEFAKKLTTTKMKYRESVKAKFKSVVTEGPTVVTKQNTQEVFISDPRLPYPSFGETFSQNVFKKKPDIHETLDKLLTATYLNRIITSKEKRAKQPTPVKI